MGSIPVSGIENQALGRGSLKRKPKARSLLFKLENAASAWTTEWSDATFLLGQKIGKKIIAR